MSRIEEKIAAELENIEQALSHIPDGLSELSALELAGLGAVLQSIYNGVENILKQVLKDRSFELPVGSFWHRDLLLLARQAGVLRERSIELLKEYMAFRHFFAHAYALDLQLDRILPLVVGVNDMIAALKRDLRASGVEWKSTDTPGPSASVPPS